MTLLITGGAGFIGSHLAEAYLEKGEQVIVLDNLSTGSLNNIQHLQQGYDKSRLEVHIDTIFNANLVNDLIEKCETVFHLAAAVGVQYIMENPFLSIRTNIKGTEIVLLGCINAGSKLIFASTSEVYGKHLHAPLNENDNIIYGPVQKTRWHYAASKLVDEFMTLDCYRSTGLEVVITRLFNTVGPRQNGQYGMVLPRLLEQATAGNPLTVYGDGSQSRTFTSVKDCIQALILLAEEKKAVGEVVNIGGKHEMTILELARKILYHTRSDSPIKLVPYNQVFRNDFEDIHRRVPCLKKLKKLIGFIPETTIDQIIQEIIEVDV